MAEMRVIASTVCSLNPEGKMRFCWKAGPCKPTNNSQRLRSPLAQIIERFKTLLQRRHVQHFATNVIGQRGRNIVEMLLILKMRVQ